ncbi:MAG: substrate-binding domain-containing protein [Desulfuromonadaceae bacterium]|nr:substrate-binding domain-containing protein [Desulfuromonadaceae bacterium]MDD5106207.1 substrate-binding domain-containing protein [Desulfuromonadaceae bacterium]
MLKKIVSLLACICIFTISSVQAEEIIISTGSGPLDSVLKPVKDAFEKDTGIKLTILFGSASLAFKQLYKDLSETAVVGTSFDNVLDIVNKEGFEVRGVESFQHVVIGKGMVRTIVNKDNPVSKLSKEQLKDIFTGKITNWKEVGGNDSPIILVMSTLNPATKGTFKKAILGNEPFAKEVLELGHMDELRGAVEVNPEAITFGTSAILSDGVKQLETPEVFRSVTLITKGAPPAKIKKLVDYILTGPGKSLVRN